MDIVEKKKSLEAKIFDAVSEFEKENPGHYVSGLLVRHKTYPGVVGTSSRVEACGSVEAEVMVMSS